MKKHFLGFFTRYLSEEKMKIFSNFKNPNSPLRKQSKNVTFPLSEFHKNFSEALEKRISQESDAVGFAAPQFGANIRMIVIQISSNIARYEPTCNGQFPTTVLINPVWKPIKSGGSSEQYETCFSDRFNTALVRRYNKIHYSAYSKDGKKLNGQADGLLARIIQHEVDHLDGIMIIDKAKKYVPMKEVFGIQSITHDDDYFGEANDNSLVSNFNFKR